MKIFVQTYLRENDFAPIKSFGQKYFDETFWFKHPWRCLWRRRAFWDSGFCMGAVLLPLSSYYLGPPDDFATIKNFVQKIFNENFWFKPIPEEMFLEP